MTLSKEDADKVASELVSLSIDIKEKQDKIKELKAQLLEYVELEGINDTSWSADGGYVEISTKVKYDLPEIPADVQVDPSVCAIDVAEKAFTSKIVLSKEGKQMLKDGYPSIMNLVIPKEKKALKVVI